jgi:hypothetical protein
MPAISHRDRLLEEIQANPQIALAYNPAAGDTTAPNLGSLPGVPDLSLQGGATLQTPGLIQGGASAVLDGVSGYGDSGLVTRTNLCSNPLKKWKNFFSQNFGTTTVEEKEPGLTYAVCTSAAGTGGNTQFMPTGNLGPGSVGKDGFAVKPGESFTASINFPVLEGSGLTIAYGLTFRNAEGTFLSTLRQLVATPGESTHTFVVPNGTAIANPFIIVTASAALTEVVTGKFAWKEPIYERGATVGPFAPTPEQLASGLAGWAGTPNESESDIGPFARGTSRVFMGAASLIKPASDLCAVFGGRIGSNHNGLKVLADGSVLFGNSASEISFGKVWEFGKRIIWAVAYDDSTRNVTVYLNGASIGTLTLGSFRTAQDAQHLLIGARESALGSPQTMADGSMLPFLMAMAPSGQEPLSGEEIARYTLVMERGGEAPPDLGGELAVELDDYEATVELDDYEATVELGGGI